MIFEIIIGILVVAILLVISFVLFLVWFLDGIFESIQPVPPIKAPKSCENEPNPLFRHFPNLKSKLAWEELGVFPTPLHQGQLTKGNRTFNFWLKREDLSSPLYGGNKVRTLQYQLPACQIHSEQNPSCKFFVEGSGGSNQVVATMVHGAPLGLKLNVYYPSPDAPCIDNTLNLLSALSLGPQSIALWDISEILRQVIRLVSALRSNVDKVYGVGGNSIGGILGQMGGALELAEQIQSGEIPDVDEIYLPMGSSCTSAGLILGVCLARHLKLNAFKSHRFKIVSVMVHGGLALANRKSNIIRNIGGKYLSFSPKFGILRVAKYFKKLTGIDLEPAAIQFFEQEWDLMDEDEHVGSYGAHSIKSGIASALDEHLEVSGSCPPWIQNSKPPIPWLDGHFAGKAFGVMLERLEKSDEKKEVLLWQTKSNVQPRGKEDEWAEIQRQVIKSKVLKKWTKDGKAASVLRPGKVDVENGTASDYRHLMTSI